MKQGKIFFHPIDGSGSLTISWSSSPKGDSVEAKKGSGVGFFSEKGVLICVIFDEVKADCDHLFLEFDQNHVKITIKKGQITYAVTNPKIASTLRKRRLKTPLKR